METPKGTDVTGNKKQYRTATEEKLPDKITLDFIQEAPLRYGENPGQVAGRYVLASATDNVSLNVVKNGKGGLSATNVMDAMRALDILKYFEKPSVSVMKHIIPSGFATQFEGSDLSTIYTRARDSDARSAFGSVVVSNVPIDKATAEAIMSTHVEVVVAPSFEEGTMKHFEAKKEIRVVEYSGIETIPKFEGDNIDGLFDVKMLPGGKAIIQQPYLTGIRGIEDIILHPKVTHEDVDYIASHMPTPAQLEDMRTAWYVNIGVRSNGVVFVKDGTTVSVGSGQQERVGATEQSIVKSHQKAMDRANAEHRKKTATQDKKESDLYSYDPLMGIYGIEEVLGKRLLEGAVVSSDAFFPFRDSIDLLARVGISAVIQPGGSKNDYEVIQAANEKNIAVVYADKRCFGHF